jgi:hypothetical protein
MTWFTTWPSVEGVAYAEHPTEAAAEEHAKTMRAGGKLATHFWSEGSEVS